MASDMRGGARRPKRTTNACVACRHSKIKCSGNEPCTNCQRRALRCRFVEGNSKVMVSERFEDPFLWRPTAPTSRSQGIYKSYNGCVAFESGIAEDVRFSVPFDPPSKELPPYDTISNGHSVWTTPFTLPSRIINNTYKKKGNWIWLAPTSLWSFTVRLSLMMTEKFDLESPYTVPKSMDQEIYPLHWNHAAVDAAIDVNGLPSIDHATYLFNTVKFHLDHSFRVFDEKDFLRQLQELYHGDSVEKARECRLWFVQFLLVLAFGNAFLLRTRKSKDPPGSKFFVRAMSIMPELSCLWKESLLAIEVLAMAGLYLYSIDHREAAHIYVGQAIRIAQMDGLHTELPEDGLGAATVTRCRNLWWTLYMMDRHFSSSLGIPMITHDSDISALIDPTNSCSQSDAAFSLQVKLSHLLSFILTSVYKTEKTPLGTFLEKTKSILQTMAGHAQEIERIIHSKSQQSVETMPKGTRHITLLYHECVIIATRPLLLSILKERLEKLGHGEQDWQSFLAPTKALISTGIKSAAKTLQILSDEDSVLEVFLPFELEFTYGAAVYLTMANSLFPNALNGENYSQEAHSILDEMIYKGNRLAAARKTELTHLEMLFQELAVRIERRGIQTLTLSSPDQNREDVEADTAGEHQEDEMPMDPDAMSLSIPGDASCSPSAVGQIPSGLEFLDHIGISSDEFMSIIDRIGNPDSHSMLDPEQARRQGL
ncbi:Zn(II)2Cys6 transcription factor [Paecilomyces variotii No. 5]|uniref:Zn(II)2Cys6 transcription factor n=1 Tax=Byssochlamys spectabilis (strain No. 5 / NBRC 109023) TaxID=1356009 RepID=V5FW71_BYSSN|nr:Zn(II)2Cys6 transcription factor [Paecilomyces variotii No. 5]